jgi:hypothetical protein
MTTNISICVLILTIKQFTSVINHSAKSSAINASDGGVAMNVRARWLVTTAAVLILAVEVPGAAIAGPAQEPGLAPYQETRTGPGFVIFSAVPSGKRLVLKEVSCEATFSVFAGPSQVAAVLALSPAQTPSPSLFLPVAASAQLPFGFFNSPILLFANARSTPKINEAQSLGGSISSLTCTLTGYFVTLGGS